MSPSRHDLVYWRGAKWLVMRLLARGRIEISAIMDPTIQWLCLEEQFHWDESRRAWILLALPMPIRGRPSCGD